MTTTSTVLPAALAGLPVPGVPGATLADVADRVADGTLGGFLRQLQRVRCCQHPIRLAGRVEQVDLASGEVHLVLDTSGDPDGVLLVPCGNRRASRCPSCAELYAGDAWQIVHAGLTGGTADLPATLAAHPGLFVTVTAPSFGPVHTRHTSSGGGPAQTCRPRTGRCPHGVAAGCWLTHPPDDPRLGEPICGDCYDYPGQVVWNAVYARLFKRTVDLTYRRMAALSGRSERALRAAVRIAYLKVAEMQARGAIHFHAILRLDAATKDVDLWLPPPGWATADLLATAWRWAVGQAGWPYPHLPTGPAGQPAGQPAQARWGGQLDIRRIQADGGQLDPGVVGAYLAKYVTKSVTEAGTLDQRIRTGAELAALTPFLSAHHARLVTTCWQLGRRPDFAGLGLRRWAHCFGYRGHWLTKSRRYSTTFAARRALRRSWTRHHHDQGGRPTLAADRPGEEDAPLTVAVWRFRGVGYPTPGDRWLALHAANQARTHRAAARAARRAQRQAQAA